MGIWMTSILSGNKRKENKMRREKNRNSARLSACMVRMCVRMEAVVCAVRYAAYTSTELSWLIVWLSVCECVGILQAIWRQQMCNINNDVFDHKITARKWKSKNKMRKKLHYKYAAQSHHRNRAHTHTILCASAREIHSFHVFQFPSIRLKSFSRLFSFLVLLYPLTHTHTQMFEINTNRIKLIWLYGWR